MEGNFSSEAQNRASQQLPSNICCSHDLTPSYSDASSLTADNSPNISRCSADRTPYCCTTWTDERHNVYLHHLEVSFVEQLYRLKFSLARCSEQNQREIIITKKQIISDFEQKKCSQNDIYGRVDHLPRSTSANSCASVVCKSMYNFKHMRTQSHPSSAKMLSFHGNGMVSDGIPTCLWEFSSCSPYGGNLVDLMLGDMDPSYDHLVFSLLL